ncbi:MAG: Holliday junction resolvase RuvX [Longimonas sp.]|uniref:Holliday junction resolvase RuvX n=1 Tax=Longimonas sp. TaxID=2039626 RepID=UPI00334E34D7
MLETPPRLVGIDYGTKRVGIALSDPLHMVARPHRTVSPPALVDELQAIHSKHGIARIVIGWPLKPDGTAGAMTETVQKCIDAIREALPSVPVDKRDERNTSELAQQALSDAGVRQPGRHDKGRVDAAAAALILQHFLDE